MPGKLLAPPSKPLCEARSECPVGGLICDVSGNILQIVLGLCRKFQFVHERLLGRACFLHVVSFPFVEIGFYRGFNFFVGEAAASCERCLDAGAQLGDLSIMHGQQLQPCINHGLRRGVLARSNGLVDNGLGIFAQSLTRKFA